MRRSPIGRFDEVASDLVARRDATKALSLAFDERQSQPRRGAQGCVVGAELQRCLRPWARAGSGREALVAVMEPADLRKRRDLATADRLHRPSEGRILVQRQVTSGAMIIVQVGYQDPVKMAFVQDDDMIETFAPDRTDNALDVRRLPGRARRGQHFRGPHTSQALQRGPPIDAVAIADHVKRRRIPWKRLDDLLGAGDRHGAG